MGGCGQIALVIKVGGWQGSWPWWSPTSQDCTEEEMGKHTRLMFFGTKSHSPGWFELVTLYLDNLRFLIQGALEGGMSESTSETEAIKRTVWWLWFHLSQVTTKDRNRGCKCIWHLQIKGHSSNQPGLWDVVPKNISLVYFPISSSIQSCEVDDHHGHEPGHPPTLITKAIWPHPPTLTSRFIWPVEFCSC